MRQIIHAVKGWIRGESVKGRKTAVVYVYSPGKPGHNGDAGGGDQIAILRRLSMFVSKEAIPVTVVFPGTPSRKVPDGATQSGVEVRYATADQMKKVVSHAITAARKGHSAVLATNIPELEKFAASERIRHIRATTFEKALDNICGPIRRDQPQQQQQPRRQPQQSPAPKPQAAPAQPDQSAPEAPAAQPQAPAPKPEQPPLQRQRRGESPAKKEERDHSILDLIDPL